MRGASATKQSFNKIASPTARNDTAYIRLINSGNLSGLTSKTPWTKDTYYQEYQKSFKDGEYNLKEPVRTPFGQVIRSYFSGGMSFSSQAISSAIQTGMVLRGKSDIDFPDLLIGSSMNRDIIPVTASSSLISGKLKKVVLTGLAVGGLLVLPADAPRNNQDYSISEELQPMESFLNNAVENKKLQEAIEIIRNRRDLDKIDQSLSVLEQEVKGRISILKSLQGISGLVNIFEKIYPDLVAIIRNKHQRYSDKTVVSAFRLLACVGYEENNSSRFRDALKSFLQESYAPHLLERYDLPVYLFLYMVEYNEGVQRNIAMEDLFPFLENVIENNSGRYSNLEKEVAIKIIAYWFKTSANYRDFEKIEKRLLTAIKGIIHNHKESSDGLLNAALWGLAEMREINTEEEIFTDLKEIIQEAYNKREEAYPYAVIEPIIRIFRDKDRDKDMYDYGEKNIENLFPILKDLLLEPRFARCPYEIICAFNDVLSLTQNIEPAIFIANTAIIFLNRQTEKIGDNNRNIGESCRMLYTSLSRLINEGKQEKVEQMLGMISNISNKVLCELLLKWKSAFIIVNNDGMIENRFVNELSRRIEGNNLDINTCFMGDNEEKDYENLVFIMSHYRKLDLLLKKSPVRAGRIIKYGLLDDRIIMLSEGLRDVLIGHDYDLKKQAIELLNKALSKTTGKIIDVYLYSKNRGFLQRLLRIADGQAVDYVDIQDQEQMQRIQKYLSDNGYDDEIPAIFGRAVNAFAKDIDNYSPKEIVKVFHRLLTINVKLAEQLREPLRQKINRDISKIINQYTGKTFFIRENQSLYSLILVIDFQQSFNEDLDTVRELKDKVRFEIDWMKFTCENTKDLKESIISLVAFEKSFSTQEHMLFKKLLEVSKVKFDVTDVAGIEEIRRAINDLIPGYGDSFLIHLGLGVIAHTFGENLPLNGEKIEIGGSPKIGLDTLGDIIAVAEKWREIDTDKDVKGMYEMISNFMLSKSMDFVIKHEEDLIQRLGEEQLGILLEKLERWGFSLPKKDSFTVKIWQYIKQGNLRYLLYKTKTKTKSLVSGNEASLNKDMYSINLSKTYKLGEGFMIEEMRKKENNELVAYVIRGDSKKGARLEFSVDVGRAKGGVSAESLKAKIGEEGKLVFDAPVSFATGNAKPTEMVIEDGKVENYLISTEGKDGMIITYRDKTVHIADKRNLWMHDIKPDISSQQDRRLDITRNVNDYVTFTQLARHEKISMVCNMLLYDGRRQYLLNDSEDQRRFLVIFEDGTFGIVNPILSFSTDEAVKLARIAGASKVVYMDTGQFDFATVYLANGQSLVLGHSDQKESSNRIGLYFDKNSNKKLDIDGHASSPLIFETKKDLGGINFGTMPIVTQPMIGSVDNFRVVSSQIASSPLKSVSSRNDTNSLNNDSVEWLQIEKMVNAGIIPSTERIREYLVSSCLRDADFDTQLNKVICCVAAISRMEEERGEPAAPEFKQLLSLVESGQPADESRLALTRIIIPAKGSKN